jgi:hypothetical protein
MRNKILTGVAVAFVIFYITSNPTGAAATAGSIGDWLAGAADAFGDFLTGVTT